MLPLSSSFWHLGSTRFTTNVIFEPTSAGESLVRTTCTWPPGEEKSGAEGPSPPFPFTDKVKCTYKDQPKDPHASSRYMNLFSAFLTFAFRVQHSRRGIKKEVRSLKEFSKHRKNIYWKGKKHLLNWIEETRIKGLYLQCMAAGRSEHKGLYF